MPSIMGSQVICPKKWNNLYMENNIFGERLKDLRTEKGLSQVKLAKEIDVGKSIISSWEIGQNEPTLSRLISIAKYFGVTIDYLAGLED